jgi:hypothetical protein
VTSASVCRAFALDLERLQMEYFATSAQLGRVGTPAATSPPKSPPPISLPKVGEASLPEGVTVGSAVLAPGLHAGQRKPFRALLLGVRNLFPPLLVRYVATLDGKTIPLLLPEIRSTYLPSSDVSKFDEVTMVAGSPRSAKTRGQQATMSGTHHLLLTTCFSLLATCSLPLPTGDHGRGRARVGAQAAQVCQGRRQARSLLRRVRSRATPVLRGGAGSRSRAAGRG